MRLPHEVAVVGAGTMGAGIARVFADGGAAVRLMARRPTSLEAARGRLGAGSVLLTTSLDEALEGADLVVETIVEEPEPKREVLARAEELAAPDVILTTNTSSLPLAELAAALERPERLAGLHFLNPPELVELVEVVGTERTTPEALATLVNWMEELGKAPIVVRRDVPGFVANRLQYVCTFADVDRAVSHGLGARWTAIGPFETMDLAGLDVHAAVAANLWPQLASGTVPSPTIGQLLETGALGVKSGRGLRGRYSAAAAAALRDRRDRVLRGLPALRAGTDRA
jgi:3-hydroxybutyryl-CoA dehydrogenase